MNETKKQNYLFALYYLISFSALGGMFPFVNQYLQVNQGFTGAEIGTFTFITLIISVVIVPIWGILGDKTGKYKLLLLISLGASVVASFFYSMATGYMAVMAAGIALEICRSGMMPLSDVQAVNFTTKNNGNYGFIRSMGSLGYVVGSVVVGMVVHANDYSPMFTIYISLLLLAVAIAFTFPKTEKEDVTNQPKEEKKKGSMMLVLKDKHFLFIALISLMTGILMDSANGYVSIHMVNHLGGPANSASLFTVATALPEILLLGIIGKWFTKFGYKKVYLLSAAILTVRYIIYVFSPNITVFIAASVVHCIAVGVSTVGNLGYLKAVIPEHSYGTAVTLYTASMSIGRAVYSLVFGYILDWAGSTAIYGIAAIIMAGATFLIYKTNLFSEAESKIVSE